MSANLPPYNYQELNKAASSVSPSTIHTKNTSTYWYYVKYLLQYAISQFKWEVPESWDYDYFVYTLYGRGYLAVINTDKFGVIPQQCTLRGLNVFYHPIEVLVANPLLPGYRAQRINVDCVVIKLQPDYTSIMDKIAYYADLMSLCDEVIQINLFNSQLSYVMTAKNKTAAESLKKLYDVIHSGNPAVVVDNNLFDSEGKPIWEPFNQDVGSNYIVDKLLEAKEHLKDQLLTDLGIPTANTLKRERLITAEVQSNDKETAIMADMWLEHLKAECDNVNKMFDISMSVNWRYDPAKEGGINAGYNIANGSV